jgi:hypothetical protein
MRCVARSNCCSERRRWNCTPPMASRWCVELSEIAARPRPHIT